MGRRAVVTGLVALMVLAVTVSFAASTLRLYVNRAEIHSDVPPQIINGRTMVPIRWVAQALGADVHWDAATNSVSINFDWLRGLSELVKGAALEFDSGVPGEVTAVWRAGEGFLVQHVSNHDYSYHLCDVATGKKTSIVGFIDNARLTDITGEEILFVAKGGSDTGNFEFPYRLRYNLATGVQTREAMYLKRDVVFGSTGAWPHTLDSVVAPNDTVRVALTVTPGAVLAGGHRTPLTVARWDGRSLSLRMYGVTCPAPGQIKAAANHPSVESVEWRAVAAGQPPADNELLAEGFPYGAMMGTVSEPSVLVTINLKGSLGYNIVTGTGGGDAADLELSHTVRFSQEL